MKKILCTLCIILMVGCTTTGQAYLPHTSRVFHAKKSCVGCYDPNPIVFQTVQAAANSSGIAPCSLCVKSKSLSSKNQGYTATNYAKSGGSNSQNLPPAKSKSSGILTGSLLLFGVAAISAITGVVPTLPSYTPTPSVSVQPAYSGSSSGGYPSSNYSTQSSNSLNSSYGGNQGVAENGSYYGEISEATGRRKTVHVNGYTRQNGTYVRGHYRSPPSNTAGLLGGGGGGGFTTRPSTSPKFQELPIPKAPKPTFNQFEDRFNPIVNGSGFPKGKGILDERYSNPAPSISGILPRISGN